MYTFKWFIFILAAPFLWIFRCNRVLMKLFETFIINELFSASSANLVSCENDESNRLSKSYQILQLDIYEKLNFKNIFLGSFIRIVNLQLQMSWASQLLIIIFKTNARVQTCILIYQYITLWVSLGTYKLAKFEKPLLNVLITQVSFICSSVWKLVLKV